MTEDVLVVDVTAEDIAQGVRSATRSCPVALALKRVDGRPWRTGLQYVWYEDTRETRYAARGLRTFVERFDKGKPVEPRTFRFRRIR